MIYLKTLYIAQTMHGVPGWKVSILEDHCVVHYKQKRVCMYVCPIPNSFRDRAVLLYSSKPVDKKEILHTVSNTGIYCSSNKIGAVYLV
jgi:hypothetical protein